MMTKTPPQAQAYFHTQLQHELVKLQDVACAINLESTSISPNWRKIREQSVKLGHIYRKMRFITEAQDRILNELEPYPKNISYNGRPLMQIFPDEGMGL